MYSCLPSKENDYIMNEFHRKEITRKNMNKEVLINKSGPVYSH